MKGRTAIASRMALVVLAGATAPALAQESAPNPNHVYVGTTFGQAHWRSGCPNSATCDDTDRALRVLAGYQINRTLSVEGAYHNLGKATGSSADIKANAWEALLVAQWPFANALSGYGKLGAYRGNAKGDGTLSSAKETNYNLTYGFGLQVDVSRNVSLRGEWQAYPSLGGSSLGTKTDVDVISAGVLWRFR
jgi:opacity protein-like surface antigen